MRTLVMVVGMVAAMSGCGPGIYLPRDAPQVPAAPERVFLTARINNTYAESLFSLRVSVGDADGGVSSVQLFTDQRVPANGQATAQFSGFPGDSVSFDFGSVSLGERHTWSSLQMQPIDETLPVLSITYGFDFATAQFAIGKSWRSN